MGLRLFKVLGASARRIRRRRAQALLKPVNAAV
jgi:hypothetical protein